MKKNLVLSTDSYKITHHAQYPEDTETIYSYFESRDGAEFPYTVFFGLQAILQDLEGSVVDRHDVAQAYDLARTHFGNSELFNYDGWMHIVEKHGGKLPLRIKAVPEGSVIPTGNVLMTVENTCPKCFWLTNAMESLLTHVWYPSTVATLSRHTKEMIAKYLEATADNSDGLPFMLHDFGYRGASSHETAAIGGAGHLVNFMGTDTLPAMLLAIDVYDADLDTLAFSVPATEHSVMTSLGRDGEMKIVERLLDKYPSGILSVVADSYNIYDFVTNLKPMFGDRILERDGVFVVRPDSITLRHPQPSWLVTWIINQLWEDFGGTINKKDFKVLDSHLRILWGDGIDSHGIEYILSALQLEGFSCENIVFGMGGGLLQKVNRDNQRFAFKCSAMYRNGKWYDIQKDPLDASKKSKAGRLKLSKTLDGKYETVPLLSAPHDHIDIDDVLQQVFENGDLVTKQNFGDICKRAELQGNWGQDALLAPILSLIHVTRIDITPFLTGVSSSVQTIYQQIGDSGFSVKKVKFDKKRDSYLATAQNAKGDKLENSGRDEHEALLNLFLAIQRHNHIRNSAQQRVSAWKTTFTDKMEPIASAYAKAAIYDPRAAAAFKALADDSTRRANILSQQLKIEPTQNPDPYPSTKDMIEDIHKKRHLFVSSANDDHPIWTPPQVFAFRVVYDVLGVCVSGARNFGWHAANLAFSSLAPIMSIEAQGALFTEIIAKTAYASEYRSYGPQKIALFPEFYEPAQKAEGHGPNWKGLHPSQIPAPSPMPGLPKAIEHKTAHLYPNPFYTRTGAYDPSLIDPNAGYQSGIEPLPNNAYLAHGDPLGMQATADNASLIDTHWAELNKENPGDLARMKQAIVNAFRGVLLSPRKSLFGNTVHYQHLASVPGDETNPSVYWNTLENHRQEWNVKRFGEDARFSHRPYGKYIPRLASIVYQMNPDGGYQGAEQKTEELLKLWETEEQEKVMREDGDQPSDKQKQGFEIANAAYKGMEKRIKNYIQEAKEDQDHYAAIAPSPMDSRYPAWMGTHLKSIAQISQHVDGILKAALEDVEAHDGAGHHFRSYVLQQQISGVGPKVCSFAWLLLQPMTSQLATIDTHMLDILGYNEKDMNHRNYFRYERQLQAGRDAAGYGSMPLGQWQWTNWDSKRTGEGSHQDHSGLRVLDPKPFDSVNWESHGVGVGVGPNVLKGQSWLQTVAPDWWNDTAPARQQVGDEYDQTIGQNFRQNQIPYQQNLNDPMEVTSGILPEEETRSPWFVPPGQTERVMGRSGDTIMSHATNILGMSPLEVWNSVGEAGKEEKYQPVIPVTSAFTPFDTGTQNWEPRPIGNEYNTEPWKFYDAHPNIDPEEGDTDWWRGLGGMGHYTLSKYQEDSQPINQYLRGMNDPMSPPSYHYSHIDNALKNHYPLDLNQTLYRGQRARSISRILGADPSTWAGKEFNDHGYSSTSINPEKARAFLTSSVLPEYYMTHIHAPQGTPGAYLPNINDLDEQEWMLPRGARYRVLSASAPQQIPQKERGMYAHAPEGPLYSPGQLHVGLVGFDPSHGQQNWDNQENQYNNYNFSSLDKQSEKGYNGKMNRSERFIADEISLPKSPHPEIPNPPKRVAKFIPAREVNLLSMAMNPDATIELTTDQKEQVREIERKAQN